MTIWSALALVLCVTALICSALMFRDALRHRCIDCLVLSGVGLFMALSWGVGVLIGARL